VIFAPKFPKSTNRAPKKYSWKQTKWVLKNAEFIADFRSVKMITKTACKKSNEQNSQLKFTFKRFCTQHKIQRFLIPILIFFKSIFSTVLLVLFGNVEAKFGSYRAKYWKRFLINRSSNFILHLFFNSASQFSQKLNKTLHSTAQHTSSDKICLTHFLEFLLVRRTIMSLIKLLIHVCKMGLRHVLSLFCFMWWITFWARSRNIRK